MTRRIDEFEQPISDEHYKLRHQDWAEVPRRTGRRRRTRRPVARASSRAGTEAGEGMRTGSLFSGYDGLGIAVDQLFPGNTREWFCEYDDAPSKILTHHWPAVPNYRDVTTVDWAAMPPVDILTGGFPCQPFSSAGRREGQNDDRHLWPYVLEAIRALRPKYTLLENVAGLRSIGDHVDEYTFRCVCGWFGGRGGVHYSQGDESGNRHGHPSSDRHGDEGRRSTQTDAGRVFGNPDHADPSQPEALGRDDVDGHRRRGGVVPESRSAASSTEGRAGATGIEDRGDSNITAEDREARPSPLDPGSFGSVPENLSANHGTERAGANPSGAGPRRWDGDCPACGRTLGDGSSGSVFRSGMGTIFRDLASLGLHVRWTSLRASDIGAPHHRERLFILVTDPDRGQCDGDERKEGRGALERETPAGRGARLPADPEGEHAWGLRSGGESTIAGSGRGVALLPDTHSRRCGQSSGQPIAGETEEPATLGGVSAFYDWGTYAPAVRRWERITRPAPAPTELNSNGRPRLNAAFAEWMMGLPAGHVTSVSISRAHQLKAIGNGVCPPQAAAAYSPLLAQAVVA